MGLPALSHPLPTPRKPPALAQYNWVTGHLDIPPEQLILPLPPLDDLFLPNDSTVTLLATENGAQLLHLRLRPLRRQEKRARRRP